MFVNLNWFFVLLTILLTMAIAIGTILFSEDFYAYHYVKKIGKKKGDKIFESLDDLPSDVLGIKNYNETSEHFCERVKRESRIETIMLIVTSIFDVLIAVIANVFFHLLIPAIIISATVVGIVIILLALVSSSAVSNNIENL